ncbi:MAG: DNA-processing protein DprA, partial [Gaiellales bacterium]
IDGEAHQGALEAGGRTVAVLGSGLDHVYPAAHRTLARRIEETGLLVTEYPPATRPAPWRFPARNRIIAGLARAVVVVQARARSGALITADFALENGRDVMAVPGEITSELSSGTNQLLLHGASPVTAIRDVLEALDIAAVEARCDVRLGNVQRSIVARLGEEPASLDELAAELELAPGSLAATLAALELRAVVEEEAGTYRALPTA